MAFKVPDDTSVNNEEYKPERYIIPFAPELIRLILEKKKLTTYRFGKKYDYLRIGDVVKIQNSNSREIVATAKITSKSQVSFKNIPLQEGSYGTYRDKEHQRQVLSDYYAYIGRSISDGDKFLVFGFKLTN